MNELEELKKEVEVIKKRNNRVEINKAWETSLFRKGLILLTTYVVATLAMYAIGTPDFYINSLIPTLGFFLSTLTFPVIKNWWVKKYFTKQ